MSLGTTCWIALTLAALAMPARAEDPARAASRKTPRDTTQSAATKSSTATPAPRAASGPRTLQEIHIEGEIPAPQVLFITARDQRRFMDLNHRRYLRTSREVGERTVLPTWIDVTGTRTTQP